ncbi:MAG: hypothetical protein N4J56_007140 [Chroococcidiopsis sp. SAG 2025]|uniref:hypothetical protein n=1 Tax=Chroococcidiopsis sp. SAG 2025 TaxID=171389 RepID=UPI002936E9E1|nr:hypothetical protein [Chroococcidiopsis sp. SAG 2025]MDV2997435.1 hypothetical protein [Chroococcidiopsis sp. SAG 2025]
MLDPNSDSPAQSSKDKAHSGLHLFVSLTLVAGFFISTCTLFYIWIDNKIADEALRADIQEHLQNAAHASTTALAQSDLSAVVSQISTHSILKDSVRDRQSNPTLARWYQNLLGVQETLRQVNASDLPLADRQIVLQNVRNSLTRNDRFGMEKVDIPSFPKLGSLASYKNVAFAAAGTFGGLALIWLILLSPTEET